MEEEEEEEEDSVFNETIQQSNNVDFTDLQTIPYGTIARIEVVNFMCHKYLKVDLGPKINFVIGHNGSGKSAILTALTVALGANASTTNRAKSVSSLIKEGTNSASIVIHITNGGEHAYKPEVYPGYIVVERRLNREGASPYKIKNSSGKIISNKKEDLVAILDHMNIMVNNPLVILTQDMARKFLSDSSSEEKYRLFMHGTQLSQLRNDFDSVRESLETARTTIERKKQALPDLLEKANEAARRQKDVQEAKDIDNRIDTLNNELVWSQINIKERETNELKAQVADIEQQYKSLAEKYENEKHRITEVADLILKANEEWSEFRDSPNTLEEELDKLEKEIQELRTADLEFKSDMTNINNDVKRTRQRKEESEKLLERETAKLKANSRIKRADIQKEINSLEEARTQMEDECRAAEKNTATLKGYRQENFEKKTSLERDISEKKREIIGLQEDIKSMMNQQGNTLKAYGENMPRVLEEIKQETRWKSRKPIGPFGTTLRLKHSQYANVLESYLGKTLNAFVVESFPDKQLLSHILKRNKMSYIPIMVSRYDLYDYSSGEPDEKYLTVLRALTFEDEWVKRQMIIANKIESTLLMEDREKADQLMYNRPRNIELCFTSSGHQVGSKSGMRTDTLDTHRGIPRFQTDMQQQILQKKKEEAALKQQYSALSSELKKINEQLSSLANRIDESDKLTRKLSHDIWSIETKVSLKKEELKEDEPINLQMFEDDILKHEEAMKLLLGQFGTIKRQRDALQPSIKELTSKRAIIEGKKEARRSVNDEHRARIEKLEARKALVIDQVDAHQKAYTNMKMRFESRKTQWIESEKLVKQWINDSIDDYPDRIESTRSPSEIQTEITRHEAQAQKITQDMGASIAEIEATAIKVMQEWKDAKTLIDHMEKLCRSLAKMLGQRIERWERFRDFIGLAAKTFFAYYLQKRGDEGSLKFNHRAKKLDIRVATGDQYSKGSRQKDSRSLSGGEKSYSQISLLLSLWQSISSPIICLDEFDVFMDAVNRKQTMNMIMNAASENSSQYILITPQDASNLTPGPFVSIYRLADPERR
ncbi:P-loop containing nucleoside triphosphate hydrolase protein [Sporodiniella umbellata]|nr:P-loop containing nucleoside triphosphate hydrolase protein [Sporodiniella umbellata]